MTIKHVTLPSPPAGAASPLLHLRGGVQGDGLHRAYRAVPEQEVRVRLRQVPPLQPRAGRHHPGQGRGRQDPLQLRHRQDALQHRPGLHQAGLRGESKGIATSLIKISSIGQYDQDFKNAFNPNLKLLAIEDTSIRAVRRST